MSERGKGKSGADRRIDERVPTQIRVRLKYPDVETFLERYATNISRGGIFIQTQRTKPPGTLIRFEFQLQDASPVIRGEGRVSWVVAYDPAHAERAYGMGVKFTRLDARSKSYIERIVVQKVRRGQADNPNAPPPPEEARLGPVRDVTSQESTTPPRATPPPLTHASGETIAAAISAIPDVLTPVLPTDVEELLAAAPAVEIRPLVARILGFAPTDRARLDEVLAELDAAVATKGRPIPRRASLPRPEPRAARPAPVAPPHPEIPEPAEPETPSAPLAAEPEPAAPTPVAPAPVYDESTEPAPREAATAPEEEEGAESVDERIDRLLDVTSPGSFALDLEEMPEPPPLETALSRRTPAPTRRTPAPPPRRRSERAIPTPVAPELEEAQTAPEVAQQVEAPPEPAEEPALAVAPDATEPSVRIPLEANLEAAFEANFDPTVDLGAQFGDTTGGATVETPPDITPPAAQAVTIDMPAAEAEAASLLGTDDPFGTRGEEDPFSMDVGPMLEDADGGAPPAERTVIGAAFGFGPTATAPTLGTTIEDRGLEVTATHPPMPTEGQEEVGFFEGDLGEAPEVAEVPPDAGAQVGLPELDEPLVDDFEAPAPDPAVRAGEPGDSSLLTDTPPPADGFGALDDAFVFAQTVQAEVLPDEQNQTLAGEPVPELMIDEGLLDTTGSDEVTARQSPLPPAPENPDDDQPKKGFFRKLFGNK